VPTGKVKWYNADKGLGSITSDDGGEVPTYSSLGITALRAGQRVKFTILHAPIGSHAVQMRILEQEPRPEQQTGRMAVGGRSVFISYRRQVSEELARLIRRNLIDHGFDTFVDLENLGSGEFERAILSQIAAREHFIVLLQPGSLDQIGDHGDWLRREIAYALAQGRNVVPVTANGFEFRRDLRLPPDMAALPSFNAVPIQPGYFDAAMERLRTRFLKMRLSRSRP
jgi:cold shock CspA family protein